MFPELETPRLRLILPPQESADEVAAYFSRSRSFHKPWSPRRPESYYHPDHWVQRLQRNRQEFLAGDSLKLFLVANSDRGDPILGHVNFDGFTRGSFQACRLGYALDQAATGNGYMTEALQRAIRFVFDDLGFHRIEANYMTTNHRSGKVLQRLAFTVEGEAKAYLQLDGDWRDHFLTSLTNLSWKPPPTR